jgi:hypothetical protein
MASKGPLSESREHLEGPRGPGRAMHCAEPQCGTTLKSCGQCWTATADRGRSGEDMSRYGDLNRLPTGSVTREVHAAVWKR